MPVELVKPRRITAERNPRRPWAVVQTGRRRQVSGFELFFDVIVAFGLSQIHWVVLRDPSIEGMARFLVVLVMMWSCWRNYCWVANVVCADTGTVRRLHLLAVGGFVMLGMAIPLAFTEPGINDRVLTLVAGYLIIRLASVVALWLVAGPDAGPRIALVIATSAGCAAAVLSSTLTTGTAAYLPLWAGALVGEVAAGSLFTRNWRLGSAEHMAERCGFMIIVGLEMCLGGIALSAAGLPVTGQRLMLLFSATAMATLMWWLYFDTLSLYAEHRLAGAVAEPSTRIAHMHYSALQLALLVGMIMFGLGLRRISLDLNSPGLPTFGAVLPPFWAMCLGAGAALYLTTITLMWYGTGRRLRWSILAGAGLISIAVPFLHRLPSILALILILALCAIAVAAEAALPRSRTERRWILALIQGDPHQP